MLLSVVAALGTSALKQCGSETTKRNEFLIRLHKQVRITKRGLSTAIHLDWIAREQVHLYGNQMCPEFNEALFNLISPSQEHDRGEAETVAINCHRDVLLYSSIDHIFKIALLRDRASRSRVVRVLLSLWYYLKNVIWWRYFKGGSRIL